ncbi:MAG: 50S ribosomal protein L6 [Candidatus Portnoybacteria bacterium CG10_big_fil_rev_8_21_14_0_10_36_7]|uniref:Large ribosomal subunit protein uL6 n=1 Tax=Candidatus Portnoybacteria bacterium CG10_big_fil_rev_8_21_14_0_10_36_7 TaxID=1974812 RepID=A0A2M8KDG8_9BACT|nr:MAG: 50S ribosomal protein L6 [Candidatus Portnoybacteria bacterium CG10_big_fil_rev_8_21_14_0_10_36_7]
MSKVGKKPITMPTGVTATLSGDVLTVKSAKGELSKKFPILNLDLNVADGQAIVSPKMEDKETKTLWGTWRNLLNNMIIGASEGYVKRLELEGVGYKAVLQGKNLQMSLGFSHPILIEPPAGIEFKIEKNTILVSGIDKEAVGQICAEIRSWREPEPYKGKGIRYAGEIVRRKSGKKVGTAAA